MSTSVEPPPGREAGPASGRRDRGALADRLFAGLSTGGGLLVLVILGLILVTMLNEAFPALRDAGLGFITSDNWVPNDPDDAGPRTPEYGALTFIYGTVVVSLIAVIIAVPVSVGIALFITELAPARLRAIVITVLDLLAAIPSVVFGLWGALVVAPAIFPVYQWLHNVFEDVPVLRSVFGQPTGGGRSFATAGLIVAIMIVPIITSITREVFATVPESEKHAALALGATKWEMIKGTVFPHSFGGMVGAVMLGLGRAMGETIAITLTIGAATQLVPNIFASGNAMPSVIVQNWGESTGVFSSALIGLGVVLFAITVLINYGARVVVRRAEIRMKGKVA